MDFNREENELVGLTDVLGSHIKFREDFTPPLEKIYEDRVTVSQQHLCYARVLIRKGDVENVSLCLKCPGRTWGEHFEGCGSSTVLQQSLVKRAQVTAFLW